MGIAAAVFIAAVAYYSLKEPATPDAALVGVAGQSGAINTAPPAAVGQNSEIVGTLTMLNGIKLDTEILNGAAFSALEDFTVVLPEIKTGKSNPFAQLDGATP